MYADTVDRFTKWLLGFERTLRSTTDVFLDDVARAVSVIKVRFLLLLFENWLGS